MKETWGGRRRGEEREEKGEGKREKEKEEGRREGEGRRVVVCFGSR